MITENYSNKVDGLINKFKNYTKAPNDKIKVEKLKFGSNLYNFRENIIYEDYNCIYKNCLLNQALASIEEREIELLDNVQFELFQDLKPNSKIFCTFHYASYRLILAILLKNNIDVSLVVGNEPYTNQRTQYFEQFEIIKKKYKINPKFSIINAEDSMGFKQMIETLKNGTNLLFYLDGNSGLNEKASNLLKINFLDHQIFSRKGVPFLSYLTKSDIVPIVMKRFDDLKTHKIEIGKTIPFLKEKKDCSFSTVLSEIYSLLEKQILLKPDYWECWLYLDKYYMQHKLYKDARINDFYNKYNKSRFEEIELRSNFYLFDRLKSVFHPIHQEFYNSFKEGKLDFDKKQNDIMINHNIIY